MQYLHMQHGDWTINSSNILLWPVFFYCWLFLAKCCYLEKICQSFFTLELVLTLSRFRSLIAITQTTVVGDIDIWNKCKFLKSRYRYMVDRNMAYMKTFKFKIMALSGTVKNFALYSKKLLTIWTGWYLWRGYKLLPIETWRPKV